MREVKIIRPKRLEAGANKLQVSLDGKKAGDLANGKELSFTLDEGIHEISGQGGLLAGKGFAFSVSIPAGTYSYCFQVDMVESRSGYAPVLRPTDGQRLKDDLKIRSIIGAEVTQTLLADDIRATLTPDTVIQAELSDDTWKLTATESGRTRVLLEQGYSSTQVTGILLQAVASSLDKIVYSTAERRQETVDNLFANYLRYLPDFELVGGNALRFKG